VTLHIKHNLKQEKIMTPEKLLWQSVVYKAFLDATSTATGDAETIAAKRTAIEWITKAGRDFREVCSLAGMDHSFLQKAFIDGRVDRDLLRCAAQDSPAA